MAMDHANLLSLITPLQGEDLEALASNKDAVGQALLQAVQEAGGQIVQNLIKLQQSDPGLYAEAMTSLQGLVGNDGVNTLHEQVSAAMGPADVVVALPGGGKLEAADEETAAGTVPLLDALTSGMEIPGEAVDVKVTEEAKDKTEAAGASGMVEDGVTYLNPEAFDPGTSGGAELIAHEMTHVSQGVEAALSSPSPAQPSMRSAEGEAASMGRSFASGGGVQKATQRHPGGRARDTDATGGGGEASSASCPKDISLWLAGASFKVQLPDNNTQAELNVAISEAPLPGLGLSSVNLKFDENWELISGRVSGALSLGSYVSVADLSLRIDGNGNLSTSVSGVALNVGNLLSGTVNLSISSDGVTGAGTFAHTEVTVMQGLELSGGALAVSIDSAGNVDSSGTLTGSITGLGAFNLAAQATNDMLTGTLDMTLDTPLEVAGGIAVKAATLTGTYSDAGFAIHGGATVNVREWAEAEVEGSYDFGTQAWSANGTMTQLQEMVLGELNVSAGSVTVAMENGTLTELRAHAHYMAGSFEGDVEGDYDPVGNTVTGTATTILTEELSLADGVVAVKALEGQATVEANQLTTITGSGEAEIAFQGLPTFKITADNGTYDAQASELSGSTTVTTLRELTFGDTGSLHAKIQEGATATANVAANTITDVSGGLQFQALDAAGEFGTGSIDVQLPNGMESIDGTASFTLSADYGVPDRGAGPMYLKPGGNLTAKVTANTLEGVTITGLGFSVTNPTGVGGQVEGTADGSWDAASNMIEATVNASVAETWPMEAAWGSAALVAGGQLQVEIKQSSLNTITGQFPYEAEITGGQPIRFSGEVAGDYNGETNLITGTVDATLTEEVSIPVGADSVIIHPDATIGAEMTDSNLDTLTMALQASYMRGGELLLDGQVQEATYAVQSGEASFEADLTLMTLVERESQDGKWKLQALPNSTIGTKVQSNKLERLGGEVLFQIHDEGGGLLDGKLTNAEVEPNEWTFSGDISLTSMRDYGFPHTGEAEGLAEGFSLDVLANSTVEGSIAQSTLTSVTAALNFRVNDGGGELAAGGVNGKWDMATDAFTGTGNVALTTDYQVTPTAQAGSRLEAWSAHLVAGSGVDLSINANTLEEAQVNLEAALRKEGGDVAKATLDGSYRLGDAAGFSGNGHFELVAAQTWHDGERFSYDLSLGTSMDAQLEAGSITGAQGAVVLTAKEAGAEKATLSLTSVTYAPGSPVSGQGTIAVTDDILAYQGSEYALYLAASSGGNVDFADDELKKADGTLTLRLDKEGTPLVQGTFGAAYDASEGTEAKVSGEGTVSILSELPMTPEGMEHSFVLMPSDGVQCTFKDSALEKVSGQFNVRVDDGAGEFIMASVAGDYIHGPQPNFTGKGSIQVTRDTQLGTDVAGYSFHLLSGSGGDISVTNNGLDSISGAVSIRVDDAEGELAQIELGGTYTHATEMFDGEGSASLLRQISVAENVGSHNLSFFLEPTTGIYVAIGQNNVDEISGTLISTVHDDAGEFLLATVSGSYTTADGGSLSVMGTVDITREKSMVPGTFEILLSPGTGANLSVTNNALDQIGGTINILVKYENEDLASLGLTGDYTESNGFNGQGTGNLLRNLEVHKFNEYTLWLEAAETSTIFTVGNSAVTHIGGTVQTRLDDGTEHFIRGQLAGDYDFAGKIFTGSGSAEVLSEKHLAELNGENLYLCPGSGAIATIESNILTKVGGNIVLSMRDSSEYIVVQLAGSFEAATGKFNGKGGATVTREKLLFGEDGAGYSFWLKPGVGAEGHIVDNELTEVTGAVPFIVKDEVGPLIEGSAEGRYDAKTGLYTGNGNITLGRDLDFELAPGTVVRFMQGSGGNGEVVDSELRKLGGTLMLELWVDGEALIYMSAEGLYDAVDNKLLWVEGAATLLKPWELLGGKVIVENVSGTARIEDGELIRAGGEGTVRVPDLHSVGTIGMDWRTEGGQDIYSGYGSLNFTLFDDPATGRKTEGEISIIYNEDNTFEADGSVKYQLNQMIGGDVGVTFSGGENVDFDPVLNGSFTAAGEMVKAADLFRMEVPILPHTPVQVGGPIPIVLGFGAKGGMGLSMRPLAFTTTIGIEEFRPLAENADIPNFEALLELNWGLDFDAMLMAYITLGLGYGPVSAGAGVRGEAELLAPVELMPSGALKGGPDGFGGELGVGVRIAPTFILSIIPFVEARISSMAASYDFPGIEMDLGELFTFEWGTKYVFGDKDDKQEETPVDQSVPAPTQKPDKTHTEAPKIEKSDGGSGDVPGGPKLDTGKDLAGSQKAASGGGGGGPMSEMMEKVNQISTLAEGLGALADLVKLVIGIITAAAMAGPAGLLIYLVFEMVFGDLTWEGVKDSVQKVAAAYETGKEMLEPFLPDWFNGVLDVMGGERPSLLDALFGADDAMRDAVHDDQHVGSPAKMRGKMIYEMLNGYTGEADQECILIVMEYSARKGDLPDVVSYAGGGTWIIEDLDGYEDKRAAQLMDSAGIYYKRPYFGLG